MSDNALAKSLRSKLPLDVECPFDVVEVIQNAGRPTKYKPEYCKELIYFLAQGYPFKLFVVITNTSRRVLYDWLEKYPDFLHAKELGESLSETTWWNIGFDGMRGLPDFREGMWEKLGRVQFGHFNKQETQFGNTTNNLNVTVESGESLKEAVDLLKALTDGKEEIEKIKDVTPVKLKAGESE